MRLEILSSDEGHIMVMVCVRASIRETGVDQ